MRVSFTDNAGYSETLTSEPTAVVAARPNTPATGAPTISGDPHPSRTLTADTSGISDADGLVNATYSYQWIAKDGTADTDLAGATSSDYTLAIDDAGKTIAVRVSFTDDWIFPETLTSEPTDTVTILRLAHPRAKVNENTLLLIYKRALDESVSLPVNVFAVTVDGNDRAVDGVSVAHNEVTLVLAAQVQADQVVQVSYTKPAGQDYIRSTLGHVGDSFSGRAVVNNTRPPGVPQGLTATVHEDGAVSLAWDDPSDPSITSYQILRRIPGVDSPGTFTIHVDDTRSAAPSFLDTRVTTGTRYVYRIKARSANGLSSQSMPVNVVTPEVFTNENTENSPTLVSNVHQNSALTHVLEDFLSRTPTSYLQAFRAGDQDATIESVTLRFHTLGSGSEVTVAIHAVGEDNRGLGDLLQTFTPPRTLSRKVTTFMAPPYPASPLTLSADGRYWVKVDRVSGDFGLSSTKSDDEDDESAPGWRVADTSMWKSGNDAAYTMNVFSKVMRISINGFEGSPALPLLSVSDGTATEGSTVEFTVALSEEAADAVTVQYSTSDGTATADVNAMDGQDYTPAAGQTLTFAPGELEKTIGISTVNDTVDEDDETFTLTLSDPSENAELESDANATGTIVNDDQDELTDATIQALTLTAANGVSIGLTPAFDPLVDLYQASVPNDIESLTVTATKNHSGATLHFANGDDARQTGATSEADYSLEVGLNLVEIAVTASSGNRVKTYTVNVTRKASDDATLSAFELEDASGAAIELTPAFDPATTVYSVSVPNGVDSVTLTTAKNHASAAVVVLSTSGTNEPDEATVELSVGGNLIKAMVTAEDGNAVTIYMVAVERAGPEWSATLTVGSEESMVPVATGYSRWAMQDTELSTDEFTLEEDSYSVYLLAYVSSGLHFSLNKELPSDFTLRIGGSEYAARDSSVSRSIGSGNYWWGDRGFSWTPGETVEVSLSMNRAPLPTLEDAPPSAYFGYLPNGHDGADSFDFRLTFTQPVEITNADLKDHTLMVNGGSVSKIKTVKSGRVWTITVQPDSSDDVSIALYETANCQDLGAICTAIGKPLHNYPTLTVPGPGQSATD